MEQWSRILKIRVKRHAKSRSLLQAQFPFVSQSSLLQVKSGGLHSLVSFCTCSSIGTEGSSFLRLFMEFSCQTLQDLNHWGVHFFSFIPLFLAFLNPLLQAISHFLSCSELSIFLFNPLSWVLFYFNSFLIYLFIQRMGSFIFMWRRGRVRGGEENFLPCCMYICMYACMYMLRPDRREMSTCQV